MDCFLEQSRVFFSWEREATHSHDFLLFLRKSGLSWHVDVGVEGESIVILRVSHDSHVFGQCLLTVRFLEQSRVFWGWEREATHSHDFFPLFLWRKSGLSWHVDVGVEEESIVILSAATVQVVRHAQQRRARTATK